MIFTLRYEFTKCLQNEGFVKKGNGQTRSGKKGKIKDDPRSDKKSGSLGFSFSLRKEVMYRKKGLFFIYFHINDPQYQRYFGK